MSIMGVFQEATEKCSLQASSHCDIRSPKECVRSACPTDSMGHREPWEMPQCSSAHFAMDNSKDSDECKITYDKTSMNSFSPMAVGS